jgi:hypothetical protein
VACTGYSRGTSAGTRRTHPVILMHMLRLLIVLGCMGLAGCDEKPTPAPPAALAPPVVAVPLKPTTVNGMERIGWDQPAAASTDPATMHFVVYVDGARTALPDVSCAPSQAPASSSTFSCTAPLPRLTLGTHTLELVSTVDEGDVRESARSAPMQVTVVRTATP